MQLETFWPQRNIENNDRQSDERYQINMIDDKESDGRYEIGENVNMKKNTIPITAIIGIVFSFI